MRNNFQDISTRLQRIVNCRFIQICLESWRWSTHSFMLWDQYDLITQDSVEKGTWWTILSEYLWIPKFSHVYKRPSQKVYFRCASWFAIGNLWLEFIWKSMGMQSREHVWRAVRLNRKLRTRESPNLMWTPTLSLQMTLCFMVKP